MLHGERLHFDYMGSAEFEKGDPVKASLRRVFATGGIVSQARLLYLEGRRLVIFFFGGRQKEEYAGIGRNYKTEEPYREIDFADYEPFVQQLAEGRLPLLEWTDFEKAAQVHAGLVNEALPDTNVWFDIENDILWTFTQPNQMMLYPALEAIHESRA